MSDVLWVALRAVSFVLLLQAAGVALFGAIFGQRLAGSGDAIRRFGRNCAVLGVASLAGTFALEAARMDGELAGLWDLPLQRIALHSTLGASFGLKVLGLSLVAVSLGRESELPRAAAVIGATLAVSAFLLTGHTAVNAERWLLAPLLAIHLLVVAFWFGALLPLNMVAERESAVVAAGLVDAFSAAATTLVPAIFLAGLAMAFILVPSGAVFRQPYGELLIAKAAGFAMLMGLAALNKWRLGPAIASGARSAVTALRRSVTVEYALLVGVLSVTAIMTGLFSPD